MGLFDKIKNKNLQEKKKNNPGDALRKAIGKQAELDAAKDFQKDVCKNITPELKNTLSKKKDNLNRFFTDKPDSETLKTKPTGDEKQFKSKVKFDSGAKGKFPSGSPDLGGTQRKFVKDRRRKLDSEINKRRSAELTKSDAINRSMGGGPSTEGIGGANQGSTPLKKGKPFSKAESDAIQTRSLNKKTKQFVSKSGTTKSKGSGASTGGQKSLVVNPKSKGTTPVTVSTTKTVKQSEQSKKAKTFTKKINKANKNRKEFPGDKSGAYQAAKSDLEARKGFKDVKPGGLKADEKNPFVKTSVRKGRAAKLGGDIFKSKTKFSQKGFEKSLKSLPKSVSDKSFKPIGRNLPGGAKVSQIPLIPDPFKASTTKTGSLAKDFKFQPKDLSTKKAEEKLKKSFSQFKKDLTKQGANIEIEKKVNRPSYKIDTGSASSGGKSKGSGSRRTNIGGGGSGRSGGGNTGTSGSGSGGGGKPPKKPTGGGSLVPPGGSGGSGGGDGSGFRGKYDPKKQRITGNYDDVTAGKNMNWKNFARKMTGGGRKVDTVAPGYTPRTTKGYNIFTNKKLDAGQRAQKILQGRAIKKNLPKGLKFTKPLVQNIARNPGKYGKAGLVIGGLSLLGGLYNASRPKKGGALNAFRNSTYDKTVYHAKGPKAGKPVQYTYRAKNPKTNPPGIGPASKPQTQRTLNKGIKSGKFKLK